MFSPTAGAGDDVYDILKLPRENIKNEFSEADLNQFNRIKKKND